MPNKRTLGSLVYFGRKTEYEILLSRAKENYSDKFYILWSQVE